MVGAFWYIDNPKRGFLQFWEVGGPNQFLFCWVFDEKGYGCYSNWRLFNLHQHITWASSSYMVLCAVLLCAQLEKLSQGRTVTWKVMRIFMEARSRHWVSQQNVGGSGFRPHYLQIFSLTLSQLSYAPIRYGLNTSKWYIIHKQSLAKVKERNEEKRRKRFLNELTKP